MMKVAVGSKNPVKIAAVKEAFETIWPEKEFIFEGFDVSSGVSDQPMSDEESIRGATTRAKKAIGENDADFGVGPEGGLQQLGDTWFDTGWIVIIGKDGTFGIGSTIRLETPSKVMHLIREGNELGKVCDMLFEQTNSKHKSGFFGLMTNDALTRKSAYRDAVIAALAPFIQPKVFES